MTIFVPPAINYQPGVTVLPARWNRVPNEGPKMVPLNIVWANYSQISQGGTSNAQLFYSVCINLANTLSPQEFSQVCYLSIDNSLCPADCRFYFPDTQETILCPAGATLRAPVFPNSLFMYAFLEGGDIGTTGVTLSQQTSLSVHNTVPPAVSLGFDVEDAPDTMYSASYAGNVTGEGTLIVPPTLTKSWPTNGGSIFVPGSVWIRAIRGRFLAGGTSSASTCSFQLMGIDTNVNPQPAIAMLSDVALSNVNFSFNSTIASWNELFSLDGLSLEYNQYGSTGNNPGFYFQYNNTGATGTLFMNILYSTTAPLI